MPTINDFSKDEFISFFTNLFEESDWIIEELYSLKPFNNFKDIELKMNNIFDLSSKKMQLQVLLNHPDLADKAKIKKLTNESKFEQKNSHLDECSEYEYEEFKRLNNEYKTKFGFPFILAIMGKNKDEILSIFKSRIQSKIEVEFNQAKKEVKKIAKLRLEQLKKDYNQEVKF